MEKTVQTRSYQDPLESAFEKQMAWTFVLAHSDDNAPVYISSDDWSDREIVLPAGVILEIADVIRSRLAVVGQTR